MKTRRTLATPPPDQTHVPETVPPSSPTSQPFWDLRGTAIGLLVFLLVWRVSLFALAHFSKLTLTPNPEFADWEAGKQGVEIWNQWDANYFLHIAAEGYARPDWPAFFPLYPLLVRIIHELSFGSIGITTAGLITNLLLMGVLVLLIWRLTHLLFDREIAHRTVTYLLLFPTAIFLAAPYSEPTLMVTAIASFYAAQKKRWALAGLMGALAALSRPTGIVMLPVLLLAYWEQNRFKLRGIGFRWMWIGLVPLGTLSYFVWLDKVGRGFLGYFRALKIGWPGRRFTLEMTPFDEVTAIFSGEQVFGGLIPLVDMAAIMGAVALTILGFKSLPKAYTLYSSLLILSILVSDITTGAARYVLGMFPIFLVLARYGRKEWVDRAILMTFVPALGVFTAMYTLGYWVG